jgi:hypothetical protein
MRETMQKKGVKPHHSEINIVKKPKANLLAHHKAIPKPVP